MDINAPISAVPLVGPHFAKRLQKLNIKTVKDLLYHFPHRYQDYALVSQISRVQPGETVTIQGQIISIKNVYTKQGKKIQNAVVSDGEESMEVTWFNQPFLVRTLPAGTNVSLSGKADWFGRKKVLVSPEYEKLANRLQTTDYGNTIHTGRLVPIYPETSGISSKWLRSRMAAVLPYAIPKTEEFLPEEIKKQNNLIDLKSALKKVHFPENMDAANTARKRLAFDELFETHLLSLYRKSQWKKQKLSHKLCVDHERVLRFIHNLPFELTGSQKQAVREILKDLGKEEPMNRLLEGDVGSGKTVVAALACFVAYTNGFQSAIMAPTQILAQQHFNTLNTLLGPFGITIELLTATNDRKQKTENPPSPRLRWAGKNSADIRVGTHTLIQNKVSFDRLAFVVIDEQHRFGVAQRALLAEKGQEKAPHILTMTATPIPRTIALTLYGDLDLSTLDEMPKGRVQIKTWVVPPQKREAAYKWIRERVKETDEQAFIVCPLIEESEKETMKSVKAATAEFKRLASVVFPDLRLGLLHGRMRAQEKNEVMEKFKSGGLDILIATPVVEVGIDMPNATVMLVEAAERFGLAQLHQLRGRVGRGSKQSYCLLFTSSQSGYVATRLKALERTLSGAQLAELDLKMRGPGEIYGTMQHGFPELKIASFSDFDLIKRTREAAEWAMERLGSFPALKKMVHEKQSVAPN
ncbi:MAG: ATP-dependent DNA helicase RecG [Candidatus Blackburnbacteria bacterium]|nr:ATP-dependent DNA helicase RecG [Candidatus Blackburnbacteria bacterium]